MLADDEWPVQRDAAEHAPAVLQNMVNADGELLVHGMIQHEVEHGPAVLLLADNDRAAQRVGVAKSVPAVLLRADDERGAQRDGALALPPWTARRRGVGWRRP
jgi:hypothetical protein